MREMAPRVLVLFAREPRREALEKGFPGAPGERLFEAFARGWIDAASACGARVFIATPPDDRAGWLRVLAPGQFELLDQRGRSLGARLEDAARRASAAAGSGSVVVVGGDVPPCARTLTRAFELRESAADAVVAPARDGGVSLVSLGDRDLDLLGRFAPRRSDVFSGLSRALELRRRRYAVLARAADVDGRRELGRLLRTTSFPTPELTALARSVLTEERWSAPRPDPRPATGPDLDPQVSRGPPLAA